MPSFTDVGDYLERNRLESELSELVATCVEDEIPQPLPHLADAFRERGREVAVDWDYHKLTDELRQLVAERKGAGALFMKLSFNDAAMFSAALGDGGPNAALRFTDDGEGAFGCNAGLAQAAMPLLEPLKARYAHISRADLWALAANVALESMGGPKVLTRFGRRDAASSDESVDSQEDRLPDETGGVGAEGLAGAGMLRRIYRHKGFTDRELVALQGRKTVGECVLDRSPHPDGPWTKDPSAFDNEYFALLLRGEYSPAASASGVPIFREKLASTVMTPLDMAMLEDRKLRAWVERYADDPKKFNLEFANAWAKLQELGCKPGALAPHPDSLTYDNQCCIPNEWVELPLVTRRDVTPNATIYGFGLRPGQSLNLPISAYVMVKAPGRGRGGKGKDDFDGSDAVKPYVPISEPHATGRFELLVKRYDGGAVSQYLHALPLGSKVAFRHTRACVKQQAQYKDLRPGPITMICTGTGITPMYQLLHKVLRTKGDKRKVVLLYGSASADDILLKEELDLMAQQHVGRLTLVYFVGASAGDKEAKSGLRSTELYFAEGGWIDQKRIEKYADSAEKEPLSTVFVCGLPALYSALCGPREERTLKDGSVLSNLGYTSEMVVKL